MRRAGVLACISFLLLALSLVPGCNDCETCPKCEECPECCETRMDLWGWFLSENIEVGSCGPYERYMEFGSDWNKRNASHYIYIPCDTDSIAWEHITYVYDEHHTYRVVVEDDVVTRTVESREIGSDVVTWRQVHRFEFSGDYSSITLTGESYDFDSGDCTGDITGSLSATTQPLNAKMWGEFSGNVTVGACDASIHIDIGSNEDRKCWAEYRYNYIPAQTTQAEWDCTIEAFEEDQDISVVVGSSTITRSITAYEMGTQNQVWAQDWTMTFSAGFNTIVLSGTSEDPGGDCGGSITGTLHRD